MSIEAMKLALEALAYKNSNLPGELHYEAITALRAAIEQAEKREWQGLATEDIANETEIATSKTKDIFDLRKAFWCGARWAEAKLKEKNA